MLALITGTALHDVVREENSVGQRSIDTPFGSASSPVETVKFDGTEVLVMPRHGLEGNVIAHEVNYRANIWALKEAGAEQIIATATVGGIAPTLRSGDLVVPDQIIDYTYGRNDSYLGYTPHNHFDFTYPFTESLREPIIATLPPDQKDDVHLSGVYGCTQGPRFETAAEIKRMAGDGCDLAGMTLMPEASLARWLELDYAALCLVVNPAAGLIAEPISFEEIEAVTERAITQVRNQLVTLVQLVD